METIIAVTLLPSILIFYYIYTHDEHPEPKGLILRVAIFGALASIPVLIVVLPLKSLGLPSDKFQSALYIAFVLAAIPEEFFKFNAFYSQVKDKPAFDEPFDGIIYGVTASLGFATLENILYVTSGGLETAINRAYTAVPLHAFAGVIMGYYAGKAHFTKSWAKRKILFLSALIIPMLFHGFYDTFIFYTAFSGKSSYMSGSFGVLIVEVVFGIYLMKKMESSNLHILAKYYNVDPALLAPHLPKGVLSENILPKLIQNTKQIYSSTFSESQQVTKPLVTDEKPPVPLVKQQRRTRGFLGFMYVILGILIITFGVLALLGLFNEPTKSLKFKEGSHVTFYIAIMSFSFGFIALNGFLLFLKGIKRNRRNIPKRSLAVKTLFVLSFLFTLSACGNLMKIAEKAKSLKDITSQSNYFALLFGSLLVWLIILFSNKKAKPIDKT